MPIAFNIVIINVTASKIDIIIYATDIVRVQSKSQEQLKKSVKVVPKRDLKVISV